MDKKVGLQPDGSWIIDDSFSFLDDLFKGNSKSKSLTDKQDRFQMESNRGKPK